MVLTHARTHARARTHTHTHSFLSLTHTKRATVCSSPAAALCILTGPAVGNVVSKQHCHFFPHFSLVLLCSVGRVWFPLLPSRCIFQKFRSKHCIPTHQKDYLEPPGLTALVKSKVTLGTAIKNWVANYINQAERRELHLKDNTVSFSITNSSTRPAGETQKHWDIEAHTSGDMNWTCSLHVCLTPSPETSISPHSVDMSSLTKHSKQTLPPWRVITQSLPLKLMEQMLNKCLRILGCFAGLHLHTN